MITITNFIPLLGSFYLAQEDHNIKTNLIKDSLLNKYTFSFDIFKKNEYHLTFNRNVKIEYFDSSLSEDPESYVKYLKIIKERNISSTDLMLSIPPCGGLSYLNRSNRSSNSKTNRFIYECVKWYLAQDNNILIMENAPGIITKEGLIILKNIENLIIKHKSLNEYKLNIIKVNTINYGLPQFRTRSFIILSRNKQNFKLKNYNRPIVYIEDFLKDLYIADNDIDNIIYNNTYVRSLLDYVVGLKIIDKIKEDNKDKKFYSVNTWKYLLKEFDLNNNIFKNNNLLKEKALFIKNKLDKNLNFWDISPSVIKGKINAITGKSIYNTINPLSYPYRIFNVRELMCLMGIPNDFYLLDPLKNINHLCQSVPINTANVAIRWGIDILNKDIYYYNNNKFITFEDHTPKLTLDDNNFVIF